MDEKSFWLELNAAIRRSDESYIRQAFGEHPEMIGYLRGDSWLHTAVDEHLHPMIRLLVEIGCPVDVRDDDGVTPLGLACSRDNPDTVRTLLELGADPNLPETYYPLTALSLSIAHRLEILKLLVQFGCDLGKEFDHPLGPATALSHAVEADAHEVVEYLRAKGCSLPSGQGENEEGAPSFADRTSDDVASGKWGAIFLQSVGDGGDVESPADCQFGAPATAEQISMLETFFGAKLPKELKELLTEFNGVKVRSGDERETWFMTTDEMQAATRFYDDRESDLLLKLIPKVLFVCQKNGMAELWGVVIKAFKPFKRGDVVAFEHDRIDEAETASELFTQPYASLPDLVRAKWKTYE